MKKWLVGAGILAVVLLAVLPMAVSAAPKAQTVSVSLKEFKITGVPAKLKTGAVTFQVKNTGKFPHDFTVLFGPVKWKSGTIAPGKSKTLSASLKPGSYLIVCEQGAGFHISQGMIAKFTVGTFDFNTFKWKA
jgi:iron uptake system component EfeO